MGFSTERRRAPGALIDCVTLTEVLEPAEAFGRDVLGPINAEAGAAAPPVITVQESTTTPPRRPDRRAR